MRVVYTSPMSSAKQLLLVDIGYSRWANQCLLDACSNRTAEELEHDFNISHNNILATLRHICDGEKVWLDCLSTTAEGGSWRLPTGAAPELSLSELRHTWPELWQDYRQWLEALPENGLDVELTVYLPDGAAPQLTRWKILRHVLDHSTFHRGQIIGMIRSLGHRPPAVNRMDYWLVNSLSAQSRIVP